MPSLPPSTYYHYYPFGTSDLSTNAAILGKLKVLFLQSAIISILWMAGNYGLNILFIDHWNIYNENYIYLIGQLYWFLIPYTIFIYILLTMIFQPLSLNQNSKHYILITCIWSLCITFIITAIIGIKAHNPDNNTFDVSIIGDKASLCGYISDQHCYLFSVYMITLYIASFVVLFTLSTISLYIIQIHSKSYISILFQCICCCRYKYWKLICDKQYRLKTTNAPELGVKLVSSEIMSDMNVSDEKELESKFLSDIDETKSMDRKNAQQSKPNCCIQIYRRCGYWYYNLYSDHKLLLLLLVLDVSFLICFFTFTVMDGIGHGDMINDYYEIIMILWLIACFILKSWMKYIGKHLDIVRLDIKLKYCRDSRTMKQLYELTKMTSSLPLSKRMQSNDIDTSNHFKSSADMLFPSTPNLSVTIPNYEDVQAEVNQFRFDISVEIAMEIFIQVTYYTFYRDYSFIFYHPSWKQFLMFKLIHLLTIFMLYFIRILPSYYKYTIYVLTKIGYYADEPFMKHQETTPHIKHQETSQIIELSPGIDNINELEQQISNDYYNNDEDTIQMTAPDNIFAFYNRENNANISINNNDKYDRLSVPSASVSANTTPTNQHKDHKKSILDTSNITFDTYYDWRNRISIDCMIRCIIMIFITLISYCTVSIYYITNNYQFIGEQFDENQFIVSTLYFIISITSESMVYGSLYLFLKYYPSQSNDSFNIFQPFTRLYAKSTHCHHYAILFVVCSWWLY